MKKFDEEDHPRVPAGNSKGGEFTKINNTETREVNKNERDGQKNRRSEVRDRIRRVQGSSKTRTNEERTYGESERRYEVLRGRLQRILRDVQNGRSNGSSHSSGIKLLELSNNGSAFIFIQNIDYKLFHEALKLSKEIGFNNSELVDLHNVDEYKQMECYLSSDGNQGFAITKGGDLVSVFNNNPIKNPIKGGAKK